MEEGRTGSLGLADANYRMDKQQGPMIGNYIQYPVISHNGKEYEKRIYIYIHTHIYVYVYVHN